MSVEAAPAPVTTSSGFRFVHAPHAVVLLGCPAALVPLAELEYLREVAGLRYGWGVGEVTTCEPAVRAGRRLHVLTLAVRIGGQRETAIVEFDVGAAGLGCATLVLAVLLVGAVLAYHRVMDAPNHASSRGVRVMDSRNGHDLATRSPGGASCGTIE